MAQKTQVTTDELSDLRLLRAKVAATRDPVLRQMSPDVLEILTRLDHVQPVHRIEEITSMDQIGLALGGITVEQVMALEAAHAVLQERLDRLQKAITQLTGTAKTVFREDVLRVLDTKRHGVILATGVLFELIHEGSND